MNEYDDASIEYVLFDPSILKFLGVYHYNYYTSKYVLYRNIDDWLYQLKKLNENYKYTEDTAKKQLQDKIKFTKRDRESVYIDIFNYEEINKYYIYYLNNTVLYFYLVYHYVNNNLEKLVNLHNGRLVEMF